MRLTSLIFELGNTTKQNYLMVVDFETETYQSKIQSVDESDVLRELKIGKLN